MKTMLMSQKYEALRAELDDLRLQLQEANDAIDAIRNGEVDALVVRNGSQHQLYTLKSADHTYRVFIEKMKEGAVTLNREEIILYSNSQFASFVGLPLTKVIGLRITEFVPDEYSDSFRKIINDGWRSDSKGETFLKNKNNELIPFQLSVTSLELEEGEALSIILTDLTAQKENEKKLNLQNKQLEQARGDVTRMNEDLEKMVKERTNDLIVSREYFRFLADNIPVIVWTTKPDGAANYFNKQWYEYTGLAFEDSIGSGYEQVLHPDDLETTRKAWSEAINNKTVFQFEYRIRRSTDGEYIWHLGRGEPLTDATGDIMAWFGTSTNIEQQKIEMAKKDEFIGVASHELKTPLTSLKGYIQLMGQIDLPDPGKLYMERASSSLNKLQRLINDLLDVTRIQAGKLKFDTLVFELSELVRQCIENARYIYPSHEIKCEVEKNIMVNGNEQRLEQVLMNLINNAVKYSPGQKEIIVRATAGNNMTIVSVTDFGLGLSVAEQAKVFDRFYRAESSGFNISGLGMGLYISSEIIKEHKGIITVQSKLKEGSVFSFSLPLVSAVSDE